MALGIGTDGLITLGRRDTGNGVITTDIGATVTIGIITDGGGKAIEYAKLYSRSHHAVNSHLRCGFRTQRMISQDEVLQNSSMLMGSPNSQRSCCRNRL